MWFRDMSPAHCRLNVGPNCQHFLISRLSSSFGSKSRLTMPPAWLRVIWWCRRPFQQPGRLSAIYTNVRMNTTNKKQCFAAWSLGGSAGSGNSEGQNRDAIGMDIDRLPWKTASVDRRWNITQNSSRTLKNGQMNAIEHIVSNTCLIFEHNTNYLTPVILNVF